MGNVLGLVRDSEGYVVCGDWGAQPDSDKKVYFAEIGIGKIGNLGISDSFNLKFRISANFGKIGNNFFWNFLFFSQSPLQLCNEATYAAKRRGDNGGKRNFVHTHLLEVTFGINFAFRSRNVLQTKISAIITFINGS